MPPLPPSPPPQGSNIPPPASGVPRPPRSKTKAILFGSCITLIVLAAIGISIIVKNISKNFDSFGSLSESELQEKVIRGTGSDRIAQITIHGLIQGDGLAQDGVVTAPAVVEMARRAKDDDSVKAVIVDIDSPGGAVVASATIREALADLDQTKPVICLYGGELAASGGVYISMGCRKIVSHPDTITGSIGVIAEFYDVSKLLETYGVHINTIKSGNFKDIGTFARPMTDEERAMLQDLIDETYDGFVAVVAEGRNLSPEAVRSFADGRVFSGSQAKDLGMVDELGNADTAEQLAKEEAGIGEATIIEYETPFPLGSLLGLFESRFHQIDALTLLEHQRRTPGFQLSYLMN